MKGSKYLCCDICNRCRCNTRHPVYTGITRASCFRLLLDRTGRGEDVLKGLLSIQYSSVLVAGEVVLKPTHISIGLRNNPFQGSSESNLYPAYMNIGHWSPLTASSPVLSLLLVLQKGRRKKVYWGTITTYSSLDQSKSAGHSNDPVRS